MEKAVKKGKKNAVMSFKPDTIKRLLSYMKRYRGQMIFVIICVLLSALASAASSLFIENLIDDYIMPLIGVSDPNFSPLIGALILMGCIYLVGVLATLFYNRVIMTIAQGTLKKIRDDMFTKMQKLPVSFFDSHTHGEIMSLYTNDTDTLRQMIAQFLVQLVSSVFTVVAVFFCMLYISVWLTIVVVVAMGLVLVISKGVIGKSSHYFVQQQSDIADLNAYFEEIINGEKVVKVFCHEGKSQLDFKEKNSKWEDST